MIHDLKPLGAFIENTIRPLIEESKIFLGELDKHGIKVNESSLKQVSSHIFKRAMVLSIIGLIKDIFLALIIAIVTVKLCRI